MKKESNNIYRDLEYNNYTPIPHKDKLKHRKKKSNVSSNNLKTEKVKLDFGLNLNLDDEFEKENKPLTDRIREDVIDLYPNPKFINKGETFQIHNQNSNNNKIQNNQRENYLYLKKKIVVPPIKLKEIKNTITDEMFLNNYDKNIIITNNNVNLIFDTSDLEDKEEELDQSGKFSYNSQNEIDVQFDNQVENKRRYIDNHQNR